MLMYTVFFIFISIFVYLYWYFVEALTFFEVRNIPHVKPRSIFDVFKDILFRKKPTLKELQEAYETLKSHKIGGFFIFHKPIYMICDTEVLKNVFIKDFKFFPDRGTPNNSKEEPLSNHLANMRGEQWKNLRIKLTPAFSNSKMKMMFPLIKSCGNNLIHVLEKFNPNDEIDIRDLCARFTTDVIASCAFGLEINTLINPKSKFREVYRTMKNNQFVTLMRDIFPNISPFIIKLFNLRYFKKEAEEYFFSLVQGIVKYREEHKIIRHDFLDLLIALKNNIDLNKTQDLIDERYLEKFLSEIGKKNVKSNLNMTNDLMVAQSFLFLIAGFETTSLAISFVLFELAQHPEIQNKVRKEIVEILRENENQLTYEVMKKMKYTDMVIAETLRIHPPVSGIIRRCENNYILPNTKITLKRNDLILIPNFGFHRDEDYFEKAYEFYPEHFTDEAIANRLNFSYLPFGEGPRMCVAVRFAKMEIKTALIYFLTSYSYQISTKMKVSIESMKNKGLCDMKAGILLNCKKI